MSCALTTFGGGGGGGANFWAPFTGKLLQLEIYAYMCVHDRLELYLAMLGLNTVGGVPCCLPVRLLLKLPPRFRLMKGWGKI